MRWNNIEDCEYPVCDSDEAVPVWAVSNDEVVEAWYRSPRIDECWFESDTGKVIEASLWVEALSVINKPELPQAN